MILAFANLLYFVLEIEVTKIASPNSGSQVHGFFAFLKIVEEEDFKGQDASDGNEVPDEVFPGHIFALLSELPGLPWKIPYFVQEVAKIQSSDEESKHKHSNYK